MDWYVVWRKIRIGSTTALTVNSVSGVLIRDAASVLGRENTVATAPGLCNPMIVIKGWPFVSVTV
jgi:hypothetical protein